MKQKPTLIFLYYGITLFAASLCAQPCRSQIDTASSYAEGEKRAKLWIAEFKEYKRINAAEFDKLPHLTSKAHIESTGQAAKEYRKTRGEGGKAYEEGHLEEAEEKMSAALSIWEHPIDRFGFALTLIEEKKYLEALPSCVDLAFEEHIDLGTFRLPVTPEYTPVTHLMLAHVLAQIGEVHTAAIVYNYARKLIDEGLKREIERIPEDKRQKAIALNAGYRLPLPPLKLDPEKTDRKTLLEATRTLFLKPQGGYFTFSTNRLAYKMIEDAYADNPNSAEMQFFKGWITQLPLKGGPREDLAAYKACQPYFAKAAELAGTKSTLGKMALECLQQVKGAEVTQQQLVDELGP